MATTGLIEEKVEEVIEEMKRTGLWKKNPPWVNEYEERVISTSTDFIEWLQFVYLANLSHHHQNRQTSKRKSYIVPQALVFFGEDLKKGKLLQLLIELDALL